MLHHFISSMASRRLLIILLSFGSYAFAQTLANGSNVTTGTNGTFSTSIASSSTLPNLTTVQSSTTQSSSVAMGDIVASGLGLSRSESSSSIQYSSTPTLTPSSGLSSLTQNGNTLYTSNSSTNSPSSSATQTFSFSYDNNTSTAGQNATSTLNINSTISNNTNTLPQCVSDLSSWSLAQSSWLAQPGNVVTSNISVTSLSSTYVGTNNATAYTTLCDGWPRASGSYHISRVVTVTSYTTTTSVVSPYPTLAPQCSFNDNQCSRWWSTHDACSISNQIQQSDLGANGTVDCGAYLISPPCSQPSGFAFSPSASLCGGRCTLYAPEMQLLYWPVTTVGGNICNETGSTITNTMPLSAIVDGTTIASPDVAFSIPSIYAYDECGDVGTRMTNVVVTMPGTDVYSGLRNGMHIVQGSAMLNYADLAPNHVPASAWFNQPICGSVSMWSSQFINATGAAWTSSFGQQYPGCGTIWEGEYQPVLVNPTQVNGLQPAWAGCTAVFGLYDPPKALTQVDSAAGVTTDPGQVASQQATPSQTIQPVQQTASPNSLPGSSNPAPAASAIVQPDTVASPTPAADPGSKANAQSADAQSQQVPDPGNSPAANVQQTPANAGGAIASVLAAANAPSVQATSGSDPAGSNGGSSNNGNSPSGQNEVGSNSGNGAAVSPVAIVTLGSSTLTAQAPANADGSVVVGSAKIPVGGTTLINNTPVSVASNGIVVGGGAGSGSGDSAPAQTIAFTTPASDPGNGQTQADSTIVNVGGTNVVASSAGNAIIVGSNTLSVGGPVQTLNGQIVSAASNGLVVGSSTVPVPNVAVSKATEAVVTGTSGQRITVLQQGSAVVIADGSSTTTVPLDSQVIFDGQTISVPSHGGSAVVDGSTIAMQTITGNAAFAQATGAVITGAGGQRITVLQQGSSVLLEDGSSTVTLAPGAQTIFDGQTISAPKSATGIVVDDGSTITLSTITSAADGVKATEAVITGADGKPITILQSNGVEIVEDATTTFTLPAGSQTVIDGETLSVPRTTSGVLVVDGSTVRLSTVMTTSSSSSRVGQTAAAQTSSKKSGAVVNTALPQMLLVIITSMLVVLIF